MDHRQTLLKYGGRKTLNHPLARDRFLQTILDLTGILSHGYQFWVVWPLENFALLDRLSALRVDTKYEE